MKRKAIVIIFLFLSIHSFGNIYEKLEGITILVKNTKAQEALNALNKIRINKSNKLKAKQLFLYSWIYYELKNYKKALYFSKKIILKYRKTHFYYPSLILASRVSYLLGNQKTATKIINWIIKHPSSKEEYLFAAYFFKGLWESKFGNDVKHQFKLDVFRILWDVLDISDVDLNIKGDKKNYRPQADEKVEVEPIKKKSVSIKKIVTNNKKDIHIKKVKNKEVQPKILKRIVRKNENRKRNLVNEHKKTIVQKRRGQNKIISKYSANKEVEQLRKLIIIKEKELKVIRMLLAEKKRLLRLKEEYLDRREKLMREKKGEEDEK